ncbi:unnamed protein product [Enterobius vermicularis]|uniref:Uncharacterized protein n=1 Tax=Enterobius vermicularis TaxID=51028 RepID=A0A0N4VPA9_ENTVE|nr:unnamed protein product [Enterobius vermicularis]
MGLLWHSVKGLSRSAGNSEIRCRQNKGRRGSGNNPRTGPQAGEVKENGEEPRKAAGIRPRQIQQTIWDREGGKANHDFNKKPRPT